jgi:hypothetical protein
LLWMGCKKWYGCYGFDSLGSDGSEKHAFGNHRKLDPYYIVSEYLAKLCLAVMWKADIVSNEYGCASQFSKFWRFCSE